MKNTIPEWAQSITIYEVNLRQYTNSGTIKEFRKHLPRLKALGVGVLWFMPIQPTGIINRKGSLGSVYSISNYIEIDSSYGTMEEFKILISEIHNFGMFVILDWVANHTSWDHIWVKEYPDFYKLNENHEVYPPFPEWSDVIGLDYTNPNLQNKMIEAMNFWRSAGVDGFRCDMAHLVPTEFWEKAHSELEKSHEDILMLAETDELDLLRDAFHMSYDWKIYHEMNELMRGNQTVPGLRESIIEQDLIYPKQSALLRFISNHDENSWQGSEIERLSYGLEAFTLMYFTLPGIPLIYSGQESGNTKRLSFFDKDCIDWKGDKMFRFYQQLIDLKRSNKLLWGGQEGGRLSVLETNRPDAILAFKRSNSTKELLVLLNLTPNMIEFTIQSFGDEVSCLDIINGYLPVTLNESTLFSLRPWGYNLLIPV